MVDVFSVGIGFNVALNGADKIKGVADDLQKLAGTVSEIEDKIKALGSVIDSAFGSAQFVTFNRELKDSLSTLQQMSSTMSRMRMPSGNVGGSSSGGGAGGSRSRGGSQVPYTAAEYQLAAYEHGAYNDRVKKADQAARAADRASKAQALADLKAHNAAIAQEDKASREAAIAALKGHRAAVASETKALNFERKLQVDDATRMNREFDRANSGSGVLGVIGGMYVLGHVVESVWHNAAQLGHELASLRMQGYSEDTVNKIHAQAVDVATSVRGVSVDEAVQGNRKIASIIGEENVTPDVLKGAMIDAQAIKAMTGETLDSIFQNTFRSIEATMRLTTGGKFDPEKFKKETDLYTSAIISAGGDVNARQLAHTQIMSGTAQQFQKPEEGLALAQTMSEMFGMRAGMYLQGLNNALEGGKLALSKRGAAIAQQTGVLSLSKVPILPDTPAMLSHLGSSSKGGVPVQALMGMGINLDPHKGEMENIKIIISGLHQELLRMGKQDTPEELNKLILASFPDTVAKTLIRLSTESGQAQYQRNLARLEQTPQGEALQRARAQDPQLAMEDFQAALKSLEQEAISLTLTMGLLDKATAAMHFITKQANEHPGAATAATDIATGLGALWLWNKVSPFLIRNIPGMAVRGAVVGAEAGVAGAELGVAAGAAAAGLELISGPIGWAILAFTSLITIIDLFGGSTTTVIDVLKKLRDLINGDFSILNKMMTEHDATSSKAVQAAREQTNKDMRAGVVGAANLVPQDNYDVMGRPITPNPNDYGDFGPDTNIPQTVMPTKIPETVITAPAVHRGSYNPNIPPQPPHSRTGSLQYNTQAPATGFGTYSPIHPSSMAGAVPSAIQALATAAPAKEPLAPTMNLADLHATNLYVQNLIGGATGGAGGGESGSGGSGAWPPGPAEPTGSGVGAAPRPHIAVGGMHGGGGGAPAAFTAPGSTFAQKSPAIMSRLMSDLHITKEQAAGIVGNLGHESAGFTAFHEKGKAEGAGGIGWEQWTGARRAEYEAWSKANGLDPKSDTANLGFLEHELTGKESASLTALRDVKGTGQDAVDQATGVFMKTNERPGIPALGNRLNYAHAAYSSDMSPIVPASASQSDNMTRMPPPPQHSHTSQIDIHLDDRVIAEHMFKHMYDFNPSANPGPTGFDKGMSPWSPGSSIPR